ncbi:MAG: hypothetical protein HY099_03845, partial [Nitrospirae bacterium]|nr:hypothetical protein [Nitrospirota bacterium]
KTVVLPARNRVDLEELSDDVRRDVTVHLADNVEEVIDLALRKQQP